MSITISGFDIACRTTNTAEKSDLVEEIEALLINTNSKLEMDQTGSWHASTLYCIINNTKHAMRHPADDDGGLGAEEILGLLQHQKSSMNPKAPTQAKAPTAGATTVQHTPSLHSLIEAHLFGWQKKPLEPTSSDTHSGGGAAASTPAKTSTVGGGSNLYRGQQPTATNTITVKGRYKLKCKTSHKHDQKLLVEKIERLIIATGSEMGNTGHCQGERDYCEINGKRHLFKSGWVNQYMEAESLLALLEQHIGKPTLPLQNSSKQT
jgi:hypothetical protein